jgi:hypothetical protein
MRVKNAGRFGVVLVALGLVACPPANNPDDGDGDGFTPEEGDCADFDPTIFPGAVEICNELDDNCNFIIDETFDLDFDGFSSCTNPIDCDGFDSSVFPGNQEVEDNKDNDCDGVIDNNLPTTDDDGDGVTEEQGDCDDDDPARSPNFPEIEGDEVDNDCNAQVDEPPTPCDQNATNANSTTDVVRAIGLCNGEVISAQFVGPSDTRARALITSFGNAQPSAFEGSRMLHLSSGIANTSAHSPGTNLNVSGDPENQQTYPDPKGVIGCSTADPNFANDYTELALTIRAPAGAESASFRFQFFSAEYPRFRCSDFDDTFLALIDSDAFQGNISFDAVGNVLSVNGGFFEICNSIPGNTCPVSPASLANTGYDPNANADEDGGATRPLTTTFPVSPGETFTLRFIIFDEGENGSANFGHILDSSVLIDQFVWHADPIDDPNTIP